MANITDALLTASNPGGLFSNPILSAPNLAPPNVGNLSDLSALPLATDSSSIDGGGIAAPTIDPATAAAIAQYSQAINNTQAAINRLPTQLNSGNSAIDASFQNAINALLLSKNQANNSYTGAKQTAATDYVGAKNTIGANAGTTLAGIQRLLGSRGAGGGSAYTIAAPQAVTRAATLQRNDAGNTFGANNQSLDTNWNNFLTDYNNQVSGAGNQRDQQKSTLEQNIDTNRASLLQSIASLAAQKDQAAGGTGVGASQPYLDQANAILDKTANYTVAPINYTTSAYKAPSLSSYITTPTTPSYNGQAPANDYFSPYLAGLLNPKKSTTSAAG